MAESDPEVKKANQNVRGVHTIAYQFCRVGYWRPINMVGGVGRGITLGSGEPEGEGGE